MKTSMPEINTKTPQLDSSTNDYVVAAAKSALGVIPFAGSLLAEVAGSIIPNQRVDRIAKFAEELDKRISEVEKTKFKREFDNEEFTDLIEEAIRQVARSTSDQRRSHIASIISNGLSSENIEYSESKYLMKLLGELSDIEIIWLRSHQVSTIGGDEEFRKTHENILRRVTPVLNSPREVVDKSAIQKIYTKHLVDLGLVDAQLSKDRDGKPEIDIFRNNLKISIYRTSNLGDLLLRTIGISARE